MVANPAAASAVHGWLVLDKPLGLTSTQAIGKARKLVGGKKAGHAGTLDPLATGVLPLAFGEATKLVPYVQDGTKEYFFTVRWGIQRASDDAEGEVVARSDFRPSEKDILGALDRFRGDITQIPPVYSAIKIDGARAYDLARQGRAPEMQPRKVTVYTFDLLEVMDTDQASFRVVCGKGTYIRSLARDLGSFLGCLGYIAGLRRTKVGSFHIENAISLEKLAELSHNGAAKTALLDIGSALDDIPGLILSSGEAQRLRAGQSLLIRPDQLSLMKEPVLLATHQGLPVALVKAEEGAFCVVRGFNF